MHRQTPSPPLRRRAISASLKPIADARSRRFSTSNLEFDLGPSMITWGVESHRRACQSRRAQRRQIARNGNTRVSRAPYRGLLLLVGVTAFAPSPPTPEPARAFLRVFAGVKSFAVKKEEQHEKQEV